MKSNIIGCEKTEGYDDFDNVKHVYHLTSCKIFSIVKLPEPGKYRISLKEDDRDENSTPDEIEKEVTLNELNKDYVPIEPISSEKVIGSIVYVVSYTVNQAFDAAKCH